MPQDLQRELSFDGGGIFDLPQDSDNANGLEEAFEIEELIGKAEYTDTVEDVNYIKLHFLEELTGRLFPVYWIIKWFRDESVWVSKLQWVLSSVIHIGLFGTIFFFTSGLSEETREGYNLKLADAVYPCCLYFLYCLIVASEASCSSKLERKVMGAKSSQKWVRRFGINPEQFRSLEKYRSLGAECVPMTHNSYMQMKLLEKLEFIGTVPSVNGEAAAGPARHKASSAVTAILKGSTKQDIFGRSLRSWSSTMSLTICGLRGLLFICAFVLTSRPDQISTMFPSKSMLILIGNILISCSVFTGLMRRYFRLLRLFSYRMEALKAVACLVIKPKFRKPGYEYVPYLDLKRNVDNVPVWMQIRTCIEDFDRNSMESAIRAVLFLAVVGLTMSILWLMVSFDFFEAFGLETMQHLEEDTVWPLIVFDTCCFVGGAMLCIWIGAKLNGLRYEHIVLIQKELVSCYSEDGCDVLKATSFYDVDALKIHDAQEASTPSEGDGGDAAKHKMSRAKWEVWQSCITQMRDSYNQEEYFETTTLNPGQSIGGIIINKKLFHQLFSTFLTGLFGGLMLLRGKIQEEGLKVQ